MLEYDIILLYCELVLVGHRIVNNYILVTLSVDK